eukprot:TRINITY_DN67854_c0_g1_i3.p1 TRINITY_DN67854_c0_g1~~TRINITY_DN67854_c0_g1_i3.p1  ORF type:complete len:280 (+),score=7.13 TRINITY_DN67854_c0_g1_i3:61-900(+)
MAVQVNVSICSGLCVGITGVVAVLALALSVLSLLEARQERSAICNCDRDFQWLQTQLDQQQKMMEELEVKISNLLTVSESLQARLDQQQKVMEEPVKITNRTGGSPPVPGDFKVSAQFTDHEGWLLCDGRTMQRTDYLPLFTIIRTSFGSANASSFRIPDGRGRVLAAVSDENPTGTYAGKDKIQQSLAEHSHFVVGQPGGGFDGLTRENQLAKANIPVAATLNYHLSGTPEEATIGRSSVVGSSELVDNRQYTIYGGNMFIFCGAKCGQTLRGPAQNQ